MNQTILPAPPRNLDDRPRRFTSRWQSERALDALTFFLADVADGLGPFLVIDLTTRRGWSAADAGFAMSMLLLGTVLSQSFTGAWIDKTYHKRRSITVAAIVIALCSVGIYFVPSEASVFALQLVTGVAVTIFPPAIAAISLGLVGRNRLAARAGRNEASFHAGNVTAAGVAIGLSAMWGTVGIFYGVAVMALLSAISAQFINEADIDHELARGADRDDGDHSAVIAPMRELFQDVRIIWFTISVVLFHFANAAMLPLVGQKIGHAMNSDKASTFMAVCIIVAQITMIPVALLASRLAPKGRRAVFLIGFAVLPFRGFLYTMTDNSYSLVAIQILDGVGAGIFGVAALLVMADLTRGTGRFNFAQGIVATSIGLGAALSNYLTGIIVDHAGFNSGFMILASIAVIAFTVFFTRVPETVNLSRTKRDSEVTT